MGAEYFDQFESGNDLQKAFSKAVNKAAYEYGHRGYTGSLAEKDRVVIRESGRIFTQEEMESFAEIDGVDNDKWGPAYAIRVIDPERKLDGWYFYGYASS